LAAKILNPVIFFHI